MRVLPVVITITLMIKFLVSGDSCSTLLSAFFIIHIWRDAKMGCNHENNLEANTVNQSLYLKNKLIKIECERIRIINLPPAPQTGWVFMNDEWLPNFGGYTLN